MGAFPTVVQVGQEIGLGRLQAFSLRMQVWWARDELTRRLAAGAVPTDSRQLALRAGQITAKRTREVVAASIEDVVRESDRPTQALTARVSAEPRKVRAVRDELIELAERLRLHEPVRPRGMALLLLLLSDPERPLFGTGSKSRLASAIAEANDCLDVLRL